MEAYEIGTDVTIGYTCTHMFHTKCLMQWMCAKHDFCPFCRVYLFDVKKFKDVAEEELTEERFIELVNGDAPDLVEAYMGLEGGDINDGDDEGVNESVDNDANSDANNNINNDDINDAINDAINDLDGNVVDDDVNDAAIAINGNDDSDTRETQRNSNSAAE